VGARHALFPRLLALGAQLHPSSVVGCQFPDAAPVAWTNACRFGPAAEPVRGVATTGVSGGTSQPGALAARRQRVSEPGAIRLSRASHPTHEVGNGLPLRRSFAPCDGSCPLSLKLHSGSQADGRSAASRVSELIALSPSPQGFPAASRDRLTPRKRDRFSPRRLRYRAGRSILIFVHHRRIPFFHTGSQ
jgi:hypothetical protein